ncbi:hypothetical protein CHS0354_030501 [Potamilus streckersoni]|uniref:Uncharacterized protein n=1 Tax=Potamilus streckersoni TaxID=2493646 RepID=A0AAE0RPE8_9BIVA|nr:hypothetical protein CHS0354_030501 [Potamilus streckersoni]
MSTLKLSGKHASTPRDPLKEHIRRQRTWIRSEEQLKNWRKVSLNQAEKMHKKNGYSKYHGSERKSDITRSCRLSDDTLHTNITGSSSESHIAPSQHVDYDDSERKQTIEKCLKWMETLPSKFSGMNVLSVEAIDS